MTYQQTIDYLYEHLPMFSRIGIAAYKEDLHNTIALCEALGNPQNKFKSIHIAGTNGKGSTSHMLAAVLQKSGYKTGLYTSPHLKDFRERIRVNGEMVSESFVVDFVHRTKTISDQVQPSFFELTVAMAFEYFAQEQIDIAIVETGLGGRLDSTNIITPALSIITNIGYDHMNILGDTLEKIAYEKSGIIKPDTPVVIGEYLVETKPIFQAKAASANAPVHFAEDEFEVIVTTSTMSHLGCTIQDTAGLNARYFSLDLPGLYQAKNLRTVHCALSVLKKSGFGVTDEAEKNALANVKKMTGLHGRWEVINESPMIVLDVAHNVDGMKGVLTQANNYIENLVNQLPGPQLHFVLGMVKDKEVEKVLSILPPHAFYYFASAHISRALPAEEILQKSLGYGIEGQAFDNVNLAIDAAKKQAAKHDLIIICGSVFLVGEVDQS